MGKRRLFSLLLLTVLLVGLLLSGCRETYYTLTVSIEGGGLLPPCLVNTKPAQWLN